LVAVGFQPDGISIAQICRDKTAVPKLTACAFHSCAAAERSKALQDIVKQHHLTGATCVSVLEHGGYQLLQVEAPDVDPLELKAAIRWRIKDLIDFHVDDAVIDVFEMPANGPRARTMYAVAARRPDIDEGHFREHAEEAKAGCPVSRALSGVSEIELSARLV